MVWKCLLCFAAGGIFGIMLIGIILTRVPEPPKDLEPEIRMVSVSTLPGAADIKAVTFCIDGKKMAAIYTRSELHPIGECKTDREPELPKPLLKNQIDKQRKDKTDDRIR